jgi:hypothetical protein
MKRVEEIACHSNCDECKRDVYLERAYEINKKVLCLECAKKKGMIIKSHKETVSVYDGAYIKGK